MHGWSLALPLSPLVVSLQKERASGLVLEVSEHSSPEAPEGLSSLHQYVFEGLLGSGAFNGLLLYCVISGGHRWPHDIYQYISGQSFEKQLDSFIVPLGVSSFPSVFFKGGDVFIDFWESHGNLL